MTSTLRQLTADIIAFIRSADASEDRFNRLACALFAFQFDHNRALRSLCVRHGLSSGTVAGWLEIPAVPAGAFKEMELTVVPPGARAAVFHSSGTTGHRPSRHFHSVESLAVYEASLLRGFEPHLQPAGPTPPRLAFLTPPPAHAPHSSLVHMFGTIRRAHPANRGAFFGEVGPDGAWRLRSDELLDAITPGEPVAWLGTAFNFVHLLDHLAATGRRVALPPGSRLLETGGYKGRSRTLPKIELHAALSKALGVPGDHIVCEYGMSELSSQAYDSGALLPFGHPLPRSERGRGTGRGGAQIHGKLRPPILDAHGDLEPHQSASSPALRAPSPPSDGGEGWGEEVKDDRQHQSLGAAPKAPRLFRFPTWVRFQLISPETGHEASVGEAGLLRVCDLANVASALVVQTEDLAIRHRGGFEFIGRATFSEPRGCSLMTRDLPVER